jgi:hypothetical protein
MSACRSEWERSITEAMESLGFGIGTSSGGTWRIAVDSEGTAVDARLDGGWFTCSTPVRIAPTAADLWAAVKQCPSLNGTCKAAIDPVKNRLEADVDVPIEEAGIVADACRRTMTDLLSARRALLRKRQDENKSRCWSAEPSFAASEMVDALMDRCAEAGWPIIECENGEIRVELDRACGAGPAVVRSFGDESYRAYVPLGRHKALGPVGRAAVAAFLLNANGAVRFARTGVVERDNEVESFGEVWICERPTAALLDHTFSSLSVVSRLCEKEFKALGDETVARAYLEVRGWSSHKLSPAHQGEWP